MGDLEVIVGVVAILPEGSFTGVPSEGRQTSFSTQGGGSPEDLAASRRTQTQLKVEQDDSTGVLWHILLMGVVPIPAADSFTRAYS